MEIDIESRSFPLTEALRSHAERRLRFALARFGKNVGRVVVRLSDVNDPRGGVNKLCRLRVELAKRPDVVVEDTEAYTYNAIDRATDRAGRTLARRIDRRQTLLR